MATRIVRMLITLGSPYIYGGQCLWYTSLGAPGSVEMHMPRQRICRHWRRSTWHYANISQWPSESEAVEPWRYLVLERWCQHNMQRRLTPACGTQQAFFLQGRGDQLDAQRHAGLTEAAG